MVWGWRPAAATGPTRRDCDGPGGRRPGQRLGRGAEAAVVAGLAGQPGEQMSQAATDEPQPASFAVAAQQDLGNGQTDQLTFGQLGWPAGADALVEQVVNGDVECDDEVVEDGAHEASLEVDAVVGTSILGGLVASVTPGLPRPNSASLI
jgi:hypothetical protein